MTDEKPQEQDEPSFEVTVEKGSGRVRLSGGYTVYVGPYLKYTITLVSLGGFVIMVCYGLSLVIK